MLIINQAIDVPGMKTILLSTMQMRDNDLRVNDEPKFMVPNPTEDHNAITIPHNEDIDNGEPLRIPLSLKGVFTYFPVRRPTKQEYENTPLSRRYTLTADSPSWEPDTNRFAEQESAMLDTRFRLIELDESSVATRKISALETQLDDYSDPEPWLARALNETVNVSSVMTNGIPRHKSVIAAKRDLGAFASGKRLKPVSAHTIAKNWGIGLQLAKRTYEVTSQTGIKTLLHPTLSRRFRTNDRQLRYRRLACEMYTDTMQANDVSWRRKNKYAQVFCTKFGWVRVYPMRLKSEAPDALKLLCQREGVPISLVVDGSKEQTLGEFRKYSRSVGIHLKQTLGYSSWMQACERTIREVKRGAMRKMTKYKSPRRLWDHCVELEGYIRSHTALDLYELENEVPETKLSGTTAEIAPFAAFHWYQWVKWLDPNAQLPEPKEQLGRWLGPSTDVGPALTAKILKPNGQIVHVGTYRRLTHDEWNDPNEIKARDTYDQLIQRTVGDPFAEGTIDDENQTPEYELYEDDVEHPLHAQDADEDPDVTPEYADVYIGAEVLLPFQGTNTTGKVKRRARDSEGNLIGIGNINPILDTRQYEVEFPSGETAQISANSIAESMITQCDSEGQQFQLLDGIVDHKTDGHAVKMADKYITVKGRKHMRRTTKGWWLCARWKDGTTSWERLSDMKESYMLQIAEYATAHNIQEEPAFAWWVPFALKKRDRIIAAVNKRFVKRSHKYGIRVPSSVEEAIQIDNENKNTLWQDAIEKEMRNVRIAFKILAPESDVPIGYNFIKTHMIFDVKLDGFKRKARLVADGHMTDAPPIMTYASVVSRDTVRIALTLAALNDLEVKSSDIMNAYLTAPTEEKLWTELGPEFGPDAGKKALIVRALYGTKSAGASFSRHLADCMRNGMGYQPCQADPNLWIKPMTRPDDGYKYYAYILLYVDDCLCIHHDAEKELHQLDKFFPMKQGSIGDPDLYLGAKIRKVKLENGVEAWAMSSSKYVQEAVKNVEKHIAEHYSDKRLSKKATGPWRRDYISELDTSRELDPSDASYYQSLVGILHWMVELGRVDMITEVSKLASHLAMPRDGHLDAVLHIFSYLKRKHNAMMIFDPTYPTIDESKFKECDWKQFYGDVKEPTPPDSPEPRGREVDLRLYVDSDLAGDHLTRRSRTGFFIYMNSALITWLSKKQPTLETSVFGAEFVAMKHGVETIRSLRYKLRMMGVPLAGSAWVYGDNMSVIHNTQSPESTLKKKSNSICYHFVRESAAMGEIKTGHVATDKNPADIATKIIQAGQKRDYLVNTYLLRYLGDQPDDDKSENN